jgi:hypothetical protein
MFHVLSCQVQQTFSINKQNIYLYNRTVREMTGYYLELAITLI